MTSLVVQRGVKQVVGQARLVLFYAIATVFQLYHSHHFMYQIRRRKPEPTLLQTQGLFNVPQHIGMVREKLAFDDAVSYTQWGNGLQHR